MRLGPCTKALALTLAAVGSLGRAQETDRPRPGTERARGDRFEAVVSTADLGSEAGRRAAERALHGLGPSTLERAFAAASDAPGTPAEAERQAFLVRALERWPAAELRAFLSDVEPAAEAEASLALRLLGGAGDAGDLERMLALAESAGPGTRAALASAVAELAESDPRTLERMEGMFARIPPTLAPSVLFGVRAEPRRALASLSRLLGRVPGADPLLLGEIAHVAGRSAELAPEEVRSAVRARIAWSDAPVAVCAARAAAALDDARAVPDLIDRLSDADAAVRQAARHALESLTRKRLGSETEAWSAWYAKESRWWSGARHLVERALHGTGFEAAAALRALASHSLYREELGLELAPLLHHADPQRAVLAAAVLGELGARSAIAELERCRSRPEPERRRAAARALSRIAPDRPPVRPH